MINNIFNEFKASIRKYKTFKKLEHLDKKLKFIPRCLYLSHK